MIQSSLFDVPGPGLPVASSLPAQARVDDRATSKHAARSMKPDVLSKQRTSVLAVVQAYTGSVHDGATAYDVAQSIGIQQSVAARRLTDLHELYLIRPTTRTRPGSSNRPLTVWEAVQ